jgi:hypothetical protein
MFFYGSMPLFGLGIPYGLFKGGLKRLVARFIFIVIGASVGYLASQSEKVGVAMLKETY